MIKGEKAKIEKKVVITKKKGKMSRNKWKNIPLNDKYQ